MKRRAYLLGLGTVAVGSGSVMGLGAFRSVTAQRTATIETTADADAFLAIERDTNARPTAIGDDPLFSKSDGQLVFHFDGTDGDAAGLNDEAVSYFELLSITNDGADDISVSISLRDGDGANRNDDAGFQAYAYGFGDRGPVGDYDGNWDLGLGVGFEFDLVAGDASVYDQIETVRISAETIA